jgi:hypothetical protein
MAIPVVEFSRERYKIRKDLKINIPQKYYLDFENWQTVKNSSMKKKIRKISVIFDIEN